jgi:predicted phosphohydrolase
MLKCIAISDTHLVDGLEAATWPQNADILLHCGDFTMYGAPWEVVQFNRWLGDLPYKYKVVCAGNHEITFEEEKLYKSAKKREICEDMQMYLESVNVKRPADLLTNAIYLQDAAVTIQGVKIWASPYTHDFNDWGFGLSLSNSSSSSSGSKYVASRECGECCEQKWNAIPDNVNIVMSHGPPFGIGDKCENGNKNVGCVQLLNAIESRVRPQFHVYGHIHEGYGLRQGNYYKEEAKASSSNSHTHTTYINASLCDQNYVAKNRPITFLVPGADTAA